MTLKEFDMIRPFLPNDADFEISITNIQKNKRKKVLPTLIKETWGNHDGRYNMKCPNCGWQSCDIRPGEIEPKRCPICEDKENRK